MTMQGRFYDGRSSRSHAVEARVEAGHLVFAAEGEDHRWPLDGLEVDIHGGEARLSSPADRDARLVVPEAEWRAADGGLSRRSSARRGRTERRLLIGLVAAAAVVSLFVFVGMPMLSGWLAHRTPPEYERRMGENFDLQIAHVFPDCTGLEGQNILLALGKRIAAKSGADPEFDIAVRVVHAPMVNAFALPGGPILLTDDLIREAETPDEVAAVIAHEVAHVEKRHVMQAVWRTLGMGMVLDAVVGGGTGAGQQAVLLAGQVTDLRYSRAAEREADRRGMELLHAAGLSSEGAAPFFERLGREAPRGTGVEREASEFMATHPDVRRRAAEARAMQQAGAPALSDEAWALVRESCESPADEAVRRRVLGFRVDYNETPPDKGVEVGED